MKSNTLTYFRVTAILTLALAAWVPSMQASEIATATFTATPAGATAWTYDLVLNDPGTTNIGTFWFAWLPGKDFLATSPTNILSPAIGLI